MLSITESGKQVGRANIVHENKCVKTLLAELRRLIYFPVKVSVYINVLKCAAFYFVLHI